MKEAASLLLIREVFALHTYETSMRLHGRSKREVKHTFLTPDQDTQLTRLFDGGITTQVLVDDTDEVIKTLTLQPRNENIFRMCFGWDGVRRSLAQIGVANDGVSVGVVRQIRNCGVRDLRAADWQGRTMRGAYYRVRTQTPRRVELVSAIRSLLPKELLPY